MSAPPVFLHADLDAFFASVEQLDHPEYAGKPVIVGGLPADRRSVVSTASYEARVFGVRSAMPVARAVQLCPRGIFVRGRMERYHEMSAQVMAIFDEFSPEVQQLSVDEAFLDITGTERLFGPAEDTARRLKAAVRERTRLTVSIGAAANKYVAKIASGMNKPDGLTVVPPGGEEAFMLALPLAKIWGAGNKTQERLKRAGFLTTPEVHRASLGMLESIFGKAGGAFLYHAVRGQNAENFDAEQKSRSISNERTFAFDLTHRDSLETVLLELCHTVMFRLLNDGLSSRTVSVKVRYGDFATQGIQETSSSAVSSVDDLYRRALTLFNRTYDTHCGVRLLGVGVMNLTRGTGVVQGELFPQGDEKKRAVEQAILGLNKKYPKNQIKKARVTGKPSTEKM
ncbi:MAG: DNA polymerase IV [Spirochaetaceae bacterium]|jgi:DNA polymerase-4|nr:DNA polymerase IV [Spirochaetaceae bacterium]